jgi:PAS domain S-box-containing protein
MGADRGDSRFYGLLEAAPDAIVGVDAAGLVVFVNGQAERLFGYRRVELVGQHVEVLVPAASRGVHPSRRAGYLNDPKPRPMGAGMQLAGRRRDGSEFPAEISLSAVDTDQGVLVAAAVRDVSDRLRAEARFRGLLEAAPDAIVGVDPAGRIALVNAQTERLFGYGRDELVGQMVELLIPEAVRAIHPARRSTYFADPEPRPMGAGMQLAGRRKDGGEFPAEISLSAIETEDGLLVSAAIRDVSERVRAAEAQAQLAAIVQSSHEAIMGKSLDGVVTSWNPGAERLYGYAAEEIVGRNVEQLVPSQLRPEEREILARIARGERMEPFQSTRVRKDGSVVSVALTFSPIVDPSGGIVGVASVSRDISERLRAEAKFRGLLEAAPDAIVGIYQDGRIALVNAQTERLFGYMRDELIGQPVEVLVPDAARATHPEHRLSYVAAPAPRPMGAGMQLAGRRKDGSTFPADISLAAIETEDGTLVSAAIRDVSERLEAEAERERLKGQAERERVERQLHQSQRLESLGQLAGGVAHDFNNLLAVILNYASFVNEELAEPEEARKDWSAVREDVAQIQRAAERAANLTHQLLAFGRREVVQPRVLSLNEVVGDVERLLQRTLGEHVELVTTLAPDLWLVMADPGQLEQVLVNLAVNARDAMPGGGTLILETENVIADEDYLGRRPSLAVGRYARLRVSDTGSGMDKDVVEHAFEPFFTTKPKGDGTGLGLATVYGIIKQAGGDIEIYSEAGLGTTFSVLLPATSDSPSVAEEEAPIERPRGGETVLIVEDEEAMREVTRRILVRAGYQVIVATGGIDAIEVAQTHDGPLDLLVSDVIMPQMLGKEMAERIKQVRPGIRVLYMSGYAQPILDSQGTLEPGVTLVEKPFSAPQLLAKVRAALDANADP